MKRARTGWIAPLMTAAALLIAGAGWAGGLAAPDKASESYAIGFEAGRELAQSVKDDAIEIDRAVLLRGFADGVDGKPTTLTEGQVRQVLAAVHRRVGDERARKRSESDPVFKAMCENNAARSRAALEAFAQRPGAVKLKSGAVYEVVRKGDGEPAAGVKSAVVNYHAALLDGQPVAHGDAATVDPAGLMPGVQELLAALRVGDRVKAIIPPEAAFGAGGREGDVGPNEAIMLDVELLSAAK